MNPRSRNRSWTILGMLVIAASGISTLAQPPQPPQAAPRVINETQDPLLKPFRWRSIGPATMGGRLDDIAVVESNPSIIYLGYATGGVWKTTNNGTTWTPIFDEQPVTSIGDIAVSQSNPDIVYVGTGEPNNRQSSSFGGGVYKSIDGGRTWQYVGLKETQSIGRVVVHPKDPNIVYVAAVGHLFGANPERGLYKTIDGGKTWTNTKFIDNDTGFTDVVMDPVNPNILYAASYQRRRVPWGFNGGGPGSSIWKTMDAGKTWTRLTGNGLPDNPIIGRIGLDVFRAKPNVIYAQIEVGPSGGTGAGVNDDGSLVQPGAGRGGGGRFGGGRGQEQPPDPKRSGIWRSDDAGKTWRFLSNNNNRPMYYSQIRIDPTNDQIIYTLGAGASKSTDGGKTLRPMAGGPGGASHGDHHALWINPRNPHHLLIGNDGGLDVSYDQGETWEEVATMATGQFYAISVDMRRPYYVCGGLQDNGSWCGPSHVRSGQILNTDWYRIGGGDGFYTQNDPNDWTIGYSESQDGNTNRYDLRTGQSTSIRPRPAPPVQAAAPATAPEAEAQPAGRGGGGGFGGGGGRGGGGPSNVFPTPPPGTNFRFYWNTPFILSPHDSRIVYLGGDRLFKSVDRGQTWMASPDLTRNIGRNDRPIMGVPGNAPMASKHDGAASYSNIVTITESPLVPGTIYVGTNDGNIQLSRDGGATWKNLIVDNLPGVPAESHVSRVEASRFDAATAYATFDAHRTDDHKPYVFVTRDYGQTWTSITNNLPEGNVNVIREDPKNRNLLYLGTEYGFFISLNGGREWKKFMNGLPAVRIDDIIVHPRDNDLIVGTHGRSIYLIDDITPLQQLSDAVMAAEAHVFDVRPGAQWLGDTMMSRGAGGARHFRGEPAPEGAAISYYLKSAPQDDIKIVITDAAGSVVRDRGLTVTRNAGINRIRWNFTANPPEGGGRGRGGPGGEPLPVPAGREGGAPVAGQPGVAGRTGGAGQAAAAPAAPQTPEGGRGGRGGFGFGGGGGAPVAPGTYIARITIGGKEFIKPIVVEADSLGR